MSTKITSKSKIAYNAQYLTVDGRPWFPVMGEIHYSRVKAHRWERELMKMKAGGVTVVSAYTIWIHHEELEGQWDFEGSRNLQSFVETVKRCGLHMILRIGPWAHGEVRNGGFPDWLVEKERNGELRTRSNDERYLLYARKFYEKIYAQVQGLFLKDEGPILGVQIENEYGHCGGLTGEEGELHMKTLLAMAQEIGYEVPLYTATGWGGAVTGGMVPVMGGYCEAPWDQRVTEIEPSGNYIFTEERNDHNIGSDYGLGTGITFDMEKFPYLTAELGGGLQVTKHRRPIATAKDTAAMSMVKLGSGCNLLGYYMYHGGTNPDGKKTTLQESRETEYLNDLPVRSYDFNAPVREYGQLTDTYREIKKLAMFVKDYEELLCKARYVPQPGNPEKPEDLHSVRTAVRACTETLADGSEEMSGFFFVNNYQRRYPMEAHEAWVPTAYDRNGEVLARFDVMDLKEGEFFFRPFNLKIGDGILKSTNAIPLCILNEDVYVFYVRDGVVPDYRIKGSLGEASILTLTEEEALHVSKCEIQGREYLFLSEEDVVMTPDGTPELLVSVKTSRRPAFRVWPELPKEPRNFRQTASAGKMYRTASSAVFAAYVYEEELVNSVEVQVLPETGSEKPTDMETLSVRLQISGVPNGKAYLVSVEEVLLELDYVGDTAELYHEEQMVADNFYTGQTWEIGLSDLAKQGEVSLEAVIEPLAEQTKERLYLQEWPEMTQGKACRVEDVRSKVIYRISLI